MSNVARLARLASSAVLTATLLAACGGKGPTTVAAGDGSAGAAVAPSTTAQAKAAQKVVLRTGDLPGFSTSPPPAADNATTRAASSFETCAGAAAALGDVNRSASSPGFYKGGTTMVASVALVSPDTASARQAMADLSRDDAAGCLTSLFKNVLFLDQLAGSTTRTERLPSATVSDESVTWRTTIQVTSPNGNLAIYSDLTLFRKDKTVAALFNVQAGEPFPSAERARLLTSMLDRV